jgi:predicted O-methyltransferase YrrM
MKRFLLEPPPLASLYSPVVLSPSSLARHAASPRVLKKVIETVRRLEHDEYSSYVASFCEQGLDLVGASLGYLDLLTVLYAVAEVGQPQNYLEIGVRRGRSAAMVVAACPKVDVVGFDRWEEKYAGSDNPGGAFVRDELTRLGHEGAATFVDGDSHVTVKAFFRETPSLMFDLVTVDGDHGRAGARADLNDVIGNLRVGGVLVFDDVANPYCPDLRAVWEGFIRDHPELRSTVYDELGPGIALAVKMQQSGQSLCAEASENGSKARQGWISRLRALRPQRRR